MARYVLLSSTAARKAGNCSRPLRTQNLQSLTQSDVNASGRRQTLCKISSGVERASHPLRLGKQNPVVSLHSILLSTVPSSNNCSHACQADPSSTCANESMAALSWALKQRQAMNTLLTAVLPQFAQHAGDLEAVYFTRSQRVACGKLQLLIAKESNVHAAWLLASVRAAVSRDSWQQWLGNGSRSVAGATYSFKARFEPRRGSSTAIQARALAFLFACLFVGWLAGWFCCLAG